MKKLITISLFILQLGLGAAMAETVSEQNTPIDLKDALIAKQSGWKMGHLSCPRPRSVGCHVRMENGDLKVLDWDRYVSDFLGLNEVVVTGLHFVPNKTVIYFYHR